MKSTTQIVKIIGITLLAGCATSRAEDWRDGFYVHTDIGPAFTPNITAHVLQLGPFGWVRSKETFKSDPGIRGDLGVGYNLTKSFALEAEAGVIWETGPAEKEYFYQIPVMLNAVYRIQLSDSWKAYFGAGGGGVISKTYSLFRDPAFHSAFVYEDSDWSPGYQTEAGIQYAPSRHVEIDLGYKFLAVDEYNYSLGPFSKLVRVNDLVTHSAQLSFTWKF